MAVTKVQAGEQAAGVTVNDIKVIDEQQSNVADLVITWTANAPTAGSAQTIADGTVPTVAELGQFAQNVNTKLSAVITALEAHGLMASS